jgi:hypothetical protein
MCLPRLGRPGHSHRCQAEEEEIELRLVQVVLAVGLLVAATGCGKEGEARTEANPAVKALRAFYEAADAADGRRACGFLTDSGIRQIVRVHTRQECVMAVDRFAPGLFHSDDEEFVEVERVEDREDGAEVEAEIKGRSGGTFMFVRRGGRTLISGFKSEEG